MNTYYKKALRIHNDYPVVDAHMDLAGEISIRKRLGERNIIRKYYLENWKKAGIKIQVSSIYLETDDLPGMGLVRTLDQISCLLEEIDEMEELQLIRTQEDMLEVLSTEKIGILLYMEGLDVLYDSCHILRTFYEIGIRGASLTWSRRNALGQGCCKANECIDKKGALSELGIQTLHYMEKLNMFLDLSHMNDEGMQDIFKETKTPLIATHSNARTVEFNYRNLTDEQILLIKECGGMIGINANRYITGGLQNREGLEKLADHVEYLIHLAGEDHVGIGLDLCDSYDAAMERRQEVTFQGDVLKDQTELIQLTAILLQRNVEERVIRKVLGQNMISYFSKFLPKQRIQKTKIDISYINQSEKWPTGCESVSTVMLLQFLGITISVDEFIDRIPKAPIVERNGVTYGADPNKCFIGTPYDADSFGCYAAVIEETVNAIMKEKGLPFIAKNITGCCEEQIQAYIKQGLAVIFWATIDLKEAYQGPYWMISQGDELIKYEWTSNEHCMLLTGFDETYYYFNDPWENHGNIAYEKQLVWKRHLEMKEMAVVIVPET